MIRELRRREEASPRTPVVPYIVLGTTLLATLAAWAYGQRLADNRDNLRFENSVALTRAVIQNRMHEQVTLLRGASGFFAGSEDITREEFRLFAEQIGLARNYPGVLGIGFAQAITPGQLPDFVRSLRGQGLSNYQVTPPPQGYLLTPVTYLEPRTERNLLAMGYDMFSEPTRREAIERAMNEAGPAMSGAVVLRQETGQAASPGFLIYLPVYKTLQPPKTLAERQRLLRGFVYSPFRTSDLFLAMAPQLQTRDLHLEIVDDGGQTKGTSLFSSGQIAGRPNHRTNIPLKFAGHQWQLRLASTPAFEERSIRPLVWWILPLGAVMGALLYALTMSQYRARRRAEEQAAQLTRREASQRLLAQAGTVLSASLDFQATLARVAELAVPHFADWCAVDLVGPDGKPQRLAVAHKDPAKVRWARELQEKYPTDPDAPTGLPNVLRTGKAELYKVIPEELLLQAAQDEEHLRIIREIQFSSAIIVPMIARNRVLGALTFVWAESGFHYDEEDLHLAEEIGARAAVSIDNAQLFSENQAEIVERRRAEAQVRQLNEDLERLVEERTKELRASNQELEAFCYSVSHDLRAPLRSVDGFSKALMEDFGEAIGEGGMEYLTRVRAASKRMDELITTMLNLSRLTRAEILVTTVDMTQTARDITADILRLEGNEHVRVVVDDGMTAQADQRMMRIVYDNLIGNAVKFSRPVPNPCVEVGREGDVFYVKDNGVGFNPAYASKLFAPFERLHTPREFPGTGIGLATVQRVIHRHGGEIWAESEEGKGSRFYFTLK
jgi:CHASE1-domain containing sensor protein/signal transduction histidine kinase